MPHDVFLRKPRTFIHLSPFGGRTNTVQIGGRLFDLRKHRFTGLRNHESYTALRSDASRDYVPVVESQPREQDPSSTRTAGATRVAKVGATKKKLSAILNGGSLAPLE